MAPTDTWIPPRWRTARPGFREIADAIQKAVEAGVLHPDARLPTHRALASSLGIAVTTVTRAYREAASRGLVEANVGGGTLVRGRSGSDPEEGREGATIDLTVNSLFPTAFMPELSGILKRLASEARVARLFDYQAPAGLEHQRTAAARWLNSRGLDFPWQRVLFTAGAQHAMMIAVSTLVPRGSGLLTGIRTCYGILNVARQLDVPLVGVGMDEEGVVPAALDRAARRSGLRCVYLMPAMQNPTGACMSPERKAEIAEIARARNLTILEDDAYGFLLDDAPLASLAPERTVLITSVGKVLWPGIRIGLLVPPGGPTTPRLEGAIRATIEHATPLMGELAYEAMESGLFARVLEWKRTRLHERGREVRRRLGGSLTASHPMSPHLWLRLPAPWSASNFVMAASDRGVLVASGDDFAVSRDVPEHAVRVCIGSDQRAWAIQRASAVLAELLASGPPPRMAGL